MTTHYILDENRRPLPVGWLTWMLWNAEADRRVALDEPLRWLRISTVFVGVDYGHGDDPPLLFETMLFVHGSPCAHVKTPSWGEAEKAHAEVLAATFKTLPQIVAVMAGEEQAS